jgi:hypothetical protein
MELRSAGLAFVQVLCVSGLEAEKLTVHLPSQYQLRWLRRQSGLRPQDVPLR